MFSDAQMKLSLTFASSSEANRNSRSQYGSMAGKLPRPILPSALRARSRKSGSVLSKKDAMTGTCALIEAGQQTLPFQSPKKEQPFDPKMYREKFKDYIEALGDVRVLTPHSCRHTYVSQMQALGVDLATIQSMVGHADLDMTQHYLHVQSPVKQKAVEAFNKAFLGNDPGSSQIPVGA
jgi:integrase